MKGWIITVASYNRRGFKKLYAIAEQIVRNRIVYQDRIRRVQEVIPYSQGNPSRGRGCESRIFIRTRSAPLWNGVTD